MLLRPPVESLYAGYITHKLKNSLRNKQLFCNKSIDYNRIYVNKFRSDSYTSKSISSVAI